MQSHLGDVNLISMAVDAVWVYAGLTWALNNQLLLISNE